MLNNIYWRLLPAVTAVMILFSTTNADTQLLEGPIIEPDNNEIVLQTGQNYTLKCKGNRPLNFKKQEAPEDDPANFTVEQNTLQIMNNETTYTDYEYSIELNLINVDRFAVGYYACFDDTINSSDLLNDIVEEPQNTEHVSYIYIYVNGSILNAPMRTLVLANGVASKFLIECKPTTPDVNVKLTMPKSNQTTESVFTPKIGFVFMKPPKHTEYKCELWRDKEKSSIHVRHIAYDAPQPRITSENKYFLKGETFSVNCTVIIETNKPVELTWKIPGPVSKVLNESNEYSVPDDNPVLYNNYTIRNADKEDAGEYVCTSKNTFNNKTQKFTKVFLEKPLLIVNSTTPIEPEIKSKHFRAKVHVYDYPPAEVYLLKNDVPVPKDSKKYKLKWMDEGVYRMDLDKLDVTDAGNYTILARNQYIENSNITFYITVPASPKVYLGLPGAKKFFVNQTAAVECEVTGYPLPGIEWIFSTGREEQKLKEYQKDEVEAIYKVKSIVTITATISGNITCIASNKKGTAQSSREFLVYEMFDGFGIKNGPQTWFSQGDDATLTCLASKYDFSNLTWITPYEGYESNVEYYDNQLSHYAELRLERISVEDGGEYMCVGWSDDDSNSVNDTVTVTVAEIRPPEIRDPDKQVGEVLPFQPVNFTCSSDAVPPPQIEWYKDGQLVENSSNVEILTTYLNHTTAYSMVRIALMKEEDVGEYECRVTSLGHVESKFYGLVFKEKPSNKVIYLSVIGAIILLLVILVIYLCWKIRKEKKFRKELAAAGLLYFKEGVTKSLNPELGISEQAELLPYDDRFEFPADRLILGKQLGAGAFGVVYKAEARGIINAEETTTVAVKMVKKTADNMYIKALASELKIMVHLGKHVNIVNLLGACTKNVGKRELSVIVEYCRFGNIHRYLQQHREVFVDTLNDNPEKALGRINRGYSSTSANSGAQSDYFGSSAHTQNTDNTFLNTGNTARSSTRKASETGYLQPEWRSNYESDYSFDGRSPRPLFSRDLVCWAFQIARGMEYLANRKVLHGDLAARNILLADDNVVKICDFGLARNIYKNDEYQKKENSPLPVKWLAIECIADAIFSTQSDVWAFGIVLWELFSLAKTPYPNLSHDKVYPWLCAGNRLSKPAHADDKLYDIMMRCWEYKPTLRPSFTQLQELLGSFLDENVRNHYVELDETYLTVNQRNQTECEDYLAMVSAPDYRNLCTPSAHHYVNHPNSFFPPTPSECKHDDEGYLQMSPARQRLSTPRVSVKSDFDERKLNTDSTELTPMLTLNNLPRTGSESDAEDVQNAPLYLNMCARIEEEGDEVFEMKQSDTNNAKNASNTKNASNPKTTQTSAITNPTYAFPFADAKQNTYANVKPNGLVK